MEFGSASLLDVYPSDPGRRVAVIGAGGKSFLIGRLADQHQLRGEPVVVTTTTKMYRSQSRGPIFQTLSEPLYENPPPVFTLARPVEEKDETESNSAVKSCADSSDVPADSRSKIRAPGPSDLKELLTRFQYRVLIEADGANQRLLKIHRSFEPVVPSPVDAVITVLNLDILGRHPGPEWIHPFSLWVEHFSSEQPLQVETLESLISIDSGYHPPSGVQSWLALVSSKSDSVIGPTLEQFSPSFWERYSRIGLLCADGPRPVKPD